MVCDTRSRAVAALKEDARDRTAHHFRKWTSARAPRHLAIILAFAAVALATLAGCRELQNQVLRDAGAYRRLDDPIAAMRAVKESFRRDSAMLFYYTLSHDVKRQYAYPDVRAGWSDIKARLGVDLKDARVIHSAYLTRSPFPPQPAARVVIEYRHPEGGVVVENLLFVLEVDREFREPLPQWRLYFPYAPYQSEGHALWIRPRYAPAAKEDEEEDEPETPANSTGEPAPTTAPRENAP